MDRQIEDRVKNCRACLEFSRSPQKTQVHPWERAERPWSRVHLDHIGPFKGQVFFLVADAYTKWLDVYPVSSTSAKLVIEKLRQSFSIQGLPDVIVSDNGSAFTSDEFAQFLKSNGIRHLTTAPYHPSSNGLAERAVQTFKGMLKRLEFGKKESINTQVSRLLFAYRNTPCTVTGQSPAGMLFKTKPRTRLEQVKPSTSKDLQKSCDSMAQKGARGNRRFEEGDKVLALSFRGGERWIPGVIAERLGEVMYRIRAAGGMLKRHADQLRPDDRSTGNLENRDDSPPVDIPAENLYQPAAIDQAPEVEAAPGTPERSGVTPTDPEEEVATEDVPAGEPNILRRSQRSRKAPAHLSAYQC